MLCPASDETIRRCYLVDHYDGPVKKTGDVQEQTISTGGVTHVAKVGDTVRRPVRPFTSTVHSYLAHLRTQGFCCAPVPFGYDDAGREVLSYIRGKVPKEPLPDSATGEDVLVALAC